MAGCDKADRNRKSAGNVAYKAGKRDQVNAARKQARHGKKNAAKKLNVPRGTNRAIRREKAKVDGLLTPELWKKANK